MKIPELLEDIDYEGHSCQVVQIEDVSEANTYGEPEYLFHLMNGLGEVFPVSETELINDRKGKQCTA
jgi:hypothetical protein